MRFAPLTPKRPTPLMLERPAALMLERPAPLTPRATRPCSSMLSALAWSRAPWTLQASFFSQATPLRRIPMGSVPELAEMCSPLLLMTLAASTVVLIRHWQRGC